MSKLLSSALIATTLLSATEVPSDKTLLKYIKRNIVKNPEVTVKGLTVLEKKTHKDLSGWIVLLTTMHLQYQGKEINAPEMMFIKDGLITSRLVDMKTGNDYRDNIKPSVSIFYYNDAHLLFGNKDAKHKVLVFSDPQCPFCQEIIPEIFKAAKTHPDKIALYYYHLPLLNIHPVSDVLTRVMHVAQHEGKLDVVEKMYSLKIDPKETDVDTILKAVKAHTGYEISAKKIDAAEVKEALKADETAAGKMMVSGTPTIYIDGEWDKMRMGYEKLIK